MGDWSHWVDLELDDDDKQDLLDQYELPESQADYPCGMRLCLTDRELELLDLEADCDVGDMIDLRILAKVCHVMKTENGTCRVELQAIAMKAESEDDEDEDEEGED